MVGAKCRGVGRIAVANRASRGGTGKTRRVGGWALGAVGHSLRGHGCEICVGISSIELE